MKKFASACLLATAIAKEKLKLAEDGIHRVHPIVEALPCQVCGINTDSTQVCLGYSATSSAGWKWNQLFYDNSKTPSIIDGYYDIKLNTYSQFSGAAELLIAAGNMINFKLTNTIQPF